MVDELSPSPWALLSEGRDYDEFRELLAIACRAGASGFLGGRAIWGGAVTSPDTLSIYARRLSDLRAIAVAEGSPYARKLGVLAGPSTHVSIDQQGSGRQRPEIH